jgi:uncharacterized protein
MRFALAHARSPPMPPSAPAMIDSYGGGGFRVGETRFEGSILIVKGEVRPWPVRTLAELRPLDLADVAALGSLEVEVLLLGTGASMALAPRPVRDWMATAGVGLDVMSTPEACRMYNYLAGEGRRVAVALLAV